MAPNRAESGLRHEQIPHNLRSSIEAAYKAIAHEERLDPKLVHTFSICDKVTDIVFEQLARKYGPNLKVMVYGSSGVPLHKFFRVIYNDREWILDPTWQQFLIDIDAEATQDKMLWCRTDDIEKKLLENNLPREKHHIWKDAVVLVDHQATR